MYQKIQNQEQIRENPFVAAQIVALYRDDQYSLRKIEQQTGIPRARVAMVLRQSGITVSYKGRGRRRPLRKEDATHLPNLLAELYLNRKWTIKQISEYTHIPARRIHSRLIRYGITTRSRGRCNREDRQDIPLQMLRELYINQGQRAEDIARILGTSTQIVLRAAHDHGLAVRPGAEHADAEEKAISLINALYADPTVAGLLRRHKIPQVPPGGSISERFPVPIRLTHSLVRELYEQGGLACRHIELLTGNSSLTIRRHLISCGVQLRPPGTRSPFLRAWYADTPEESRQRKGR